MADPLEQLYTSIPIKYSNRARPSITLSYAQSLDGSIASRPDEQLVLSGAESLTMTHRLRAAHDAIFIGVNTVLADDPQLTTRLDAGAHARPVVLDTKLRTPPDSKLLQHPKPPLIVCAVDAPQDRMQALQAGGAEILSFSTLANKRIHLGKLLAAIWEMGLESVMVEGGATVIGSILTERLADAIVVTIAPILVGGVRAVDQRIIPPYTIQKPRWIRLGKDLVLWGMFEWGTE